MLTLAVCALVLLFFLGAPVFAVMVALAFVGAVATSRESGIIAEFAGELGAVASMGTGEPAQILSTIPLFIFAGYVMAEAKTADRLVRFAKALLGWLPGGLAVVTIFACALFTTFTGASGVTIVALGSLIMPSLLKELYPERFALGLICGTGSVGLLFPPALPLFVYGTVYGVSDQLTGESSGFTTDRFLFAGVVPGLVLVTLLSMTAIGYALYHRVPRHRFALAELGRSFAVALPELGLPFLVIGALALGGVSIPEVAALTVVYVLAVEIVLYRDLRVPALWRITRESMALVGAIFVIIFAATALTSYFVTAHVPTRLVDWMSAHVDSRWMFLLALNVFLLVIGMMMDIFSAIVIVVPLITPLAKQYGVDPFHLGVIFLLNLELGYLTPPVGLNLFITSFKFQRPVTEVTYASLPFLGVMVVCLGIITYVPALTVVPEAERRGRLSDLTEMVASARQTLGTVKEVALPDGKIKRLSECETDQSRLHCEELFAAVTECRRQSGAGSACESEAIQQYMTATTAADNDDWDVEAQGAGAGGDDWGDTGEGKGAGNGAGEGTGDDW